MSKEKLKNPPLVEAIFELRWELQPMPGTVTNSKHTVRGDPLAVMTDPHYKILIGKIYDKLAKEGYSYHEQLPTATIPDEMAAYVVQHRFRKGENGWPLIQIGPGIITLNNTEAYTWPDFEKKMAGMIKVLFETYPEPKIKGVVLRYIDSIEFDHKKDAIFDFFKKYMRIGVELPSKMFESTSSDASPSNYNFIFSYPLKAPTGAFIIWQREEKRQRRTYLGNHS
jgi:uncharacterized protein (TIGR04255 family)